MEEQAREVIAGRIHSPEVVVEPEGHPGERHVVTHVERRPHPRSWSEAEPAKVRILDEVLFVVPLTRSRCAAPARKP